MSDSILINVPILTRVEGEGALDIVIKNNQIDTLRLKIFEPPRLFEKFLENRSHQDVIDIVARICGICPVAYQMSAVQAIEHCYQIQPSPWVREMRRLFYCGEWIESHSLHIHLLAVPDFLGFNTAAEMAQYYPQDVRRGLRLQAFGNELIKLLGGRSVHPVGVCVGGFFHTPTQKSVDLLLNKARECVQDCVDLLSWLASLSLPDVTQEFTYVSLYHPTEYPMNEGNIVSSNGLNISIDKFDDHFKETHVPYSTALHSYLHGKPYLVGPLARINNCLGHLPSTIHGLLKKLKLSFPSKNVALSIVARAIEIYYCVLEAIRILESYTTSNSMIDNIVVKEGIGFGCTEAPRGLLWQHYIMNKNGRVKQVRIIPPTSQNQARIEEDLRFSLKKFGLHQPIDQLRAYSEMIIRNYDPCISCSTHFLKMNVIYK